MAENSSLCTSKIGWITVGTFLILRGSLAIILAFVILLNVFQAEKTKDCMNCRVVFFCTVSGLGYMFIGGLIIVNSSSINCLITSVIVAILVSADLISVIVFFAWNNLKLAVLIPYVGLKVAGFVYLVQFFRNIGQTRRNDELEMQAVRRDPLELY